MTTLAEMTLQIAKKTMSVMEGTATSGSSSTLLDTVNLNQSANYWENGTLWILSGSHSGKVVIISAYSGNKISFPDLGSTIGTPRYAAAKSTIPYTLLRQAVNSALDEIKILSFDETIVTDGSTEYTLPTNVSNVAQVETVDGTLVAKKTHFDERAGKIIFSSAPSGTLRLTYMGKHPELVNVTDTINGEVNPEWLRWAAIVNCLRYGLRSYQGDPALNMEEFLNEAYRKVGELRPLNRTVLKLRTAE